MKLTTEERKALAAVRNPCSVYSKPLWLILKRLAAHDLCEVAGPMEWQKLSANNVPLGISVITPAGKRAIREVFPLRQDRSARFERMEVAHG